MDSMEIKATLIKDKIKNKFPELKIKLTTEREDGFTDYYIVIDNEDFIKSKKFLDYLTSIYDILKDRFIHVYADKYLFADKHEKESEKAINYIVNIVFQKNNFESCETFIKRQIEKSYKYSTDKYSLLRPNENLITESKALAGCC